MRDDMVQNQDVGVSLTLPEIAERALRQFSGNQTALLNKLVISRQCFHRACHGGSRLTVWRVLRLAQLAGTNPIETLRVAGHAEVAEAIVDSPQPLLGDMTLKERALLHAARDLPERRLDLVLLFINCLVSEEVQFVWPPRRKRGGPRESARCPCCGRE